MHRDASCSGTAARNGSAATWPTTCSGVRCRFCSRAISVSPPRRSWTRCWRVTGSTGGRRPSSAAPGCPCRCRCRCTRSPTPTARAAARWRSRWTPPSSGSRSSCWQSPRRGCKRARPSRTSAGGCGRAHRHRAVEREFHRIHGVDPLEFEGTIEAHLGRIVPEERSQVRDALERAVDPVAPPTSTARPARRRLPPEPVDPGRPAIGTSGDVVGLRGIGRDVTDA